jgi:hypothetical protein
MTLYSFLPLITAIFCLGCQSQQETGRFHRNYPGESDLSTRLPTRILVVFSRILLGFIVKMWRRVPDHQAREFTDDVCCEPLLEPSVQVADARFQPFTLISQVST